MLTWALTEVNVHPSVWASTPNSRPNMSAEVERDFCDISVRRKYAAYKCPQISGNTEKFKTLELLFSYRDWIFCQLFPHLHCLTALIRLPNGKHFALVSCCTWGSNHMLCDPMWCTARRPVLHASLGGPRASSTLLWPYATTSKSELRRTQHGMQTSWTGFFRKEGLKPEVTKEVNQAPEVQFLLQKHHSLTLVFGKSFYQGKCYIENTVQNRANQRS